MFSLIHNCFILHIRKIFLLIKIFSFLKSQPALIPQNVTMKILRFPFRKSQQKRMAVLFFYAAADGNIAIRFRSPAAALTSERSSTRSRPAIFRCAPATVHHHAAQMNSAAWRLLGGWRGWGRIKKYRLELVGGGFAEREEKLIISGCIFRSPCTSKRIRYRRLK